MQTTRPVQTGQPLSFEYTGVDYTGRQGNTFSFEVNALMQNVSDQTFNQVGGMVKLGDMEFSEDEWSMPEPVPPEEDHAWDLTWPWQVRVPQEDLPLVFDHTVTFTSPDEMDGFQRSIEVSLGDDGNGGGGGGGGDGISTELLLAGGVGLAGLFYVSRRGGL
jgi:hypothetical protein